MQSRNLFVMKEPIRC